MHPEGWLRRLYRAALPLEFRRRFRSSLANPRELRRRLSEPFDRHKTRHSRIPIRETRAGPDRRIRGGRFQGAGCYYQTALINTLISLRPGICLEIGTHHGGTTKIFESYFERYRPDGILITIDVRKFVDVESNRVRQLLVAPHDGSDDTEIRNLSVLRSELERAQAHHFDFAFIDGDHSESSFLADLRLYKQLSASPHYALLDDTKDAVHECCDAFRKRVVPRSSCYDFEDWPIFVGASLVWDYEIGEEA